LVSRGWAKILSYKIIVKLKMKEVDNMDIAKEEARKLIEKLPDQATWDDIIYEFYVKKKLDVALKAAEEGARRLSRGSKEKTSFVMRLEWTEPAISDLQDIRDYIKKDSEHSKYKFVLATKKNIEEKISEIKKI
jgi:hypothetical protein